MATPTTTTTNITNVNLDQLRFPKICECEESEDEVTQDCLNIQLTINRNMKMDDEDMISLPDWLDEENPLINAITQKKSLTNNMQKSYSTPEELQIHRLHLCDRNTSPIPTSHPNQPRSYGYVLQNSYTPNKTSSSLSVRGPYLRTRPRRGALAIQYQRRLKEEANCPFVGRVDCCSVVSKESTSFKY